MEAAVAFGSSCIILAAVASETMRIFPCLDVYEMEDDTGAWFELVICRGGKPVYVDAIVRWRENEYYGAGELLPSAWTGRLSQQSGAKERSRMFYGSHGEMGKPQIQL
jgi:imidazole glycerol phosphate synthase subunit HisF